MFYAWPALLSLFSCVAAFYPYIDSSETHPSKRFYPISIPQVESIERGPIKLDLHKIEKRQNKFSYILSNKPAAPNALAIDQDGSDLSYFSTVSFGSKAQQMFMLIDTGSANTWVFSSQCTSSTCAIHNTFGTPDSTSLQVANTPWSLQYGSGTVSGIVGTDTVAFANFSVNMGFGLATNASNDFNNYPMDGILGLGRANSDQLGSPTIMQVLQKQANLAQNIIGVHLQRAADNTKDGEIIFGGVDTAKFSGTLAYTTTANDVAWEIPIDDVLVNGTPAGLTGRTAIIDTGTTFILMPNVDAVTLHALIPGSVATGETFTIPCSTNVQLQVRISGKAYTISPKDYVGKSVAGSTTVCNSNIIGHQAFGPTQWILGDVFLKNVYTVFDFDGKRIGFGMPGTGGTIGASGNTSSSSSSSSTSSGSTTVTSSTSGISSKSSGTSSGSSSSSGKTSTTETTSSSHTSSTSSARASSSGSSDSSPFSSDAGHGVGVHLHFQKLVFSILIAFGAFI